MSTTITSATIDLGDLLAYRAEVAEILPALMERLDVDDPAAHAEASAIIAREDELVESVVAAFAQHADESQRTHARDCVRDAITDMSITGDLYGAVDRYNDRRLEAAVSRYVSECVESLRNDPATAGFLGQVVADQINETVAGLFRPVAS